MIKSFFLFLTFLTSLIFADLRDLTDLKQSFVLETKKIEIPGYPEAFNPSIVKWKNKILLSFRTYDPISRSSDLIGLVWLNDNLEPISAPTILKREGEFCTCPPSAKDPRLLVLNNDLYIVYSNAFPYDDPVSRMYVGKVNVEENGSFKVSFPSPLIYYDKEIRSRKEKNWVPFVYENTLAMAYSIQPHKIFIPRLDNYSCSTLDTTIGKIKWDWGMLRGGTPALKVEGQYLAFFHSDKALPTVQSGGVTLNHYFMGAYTFEADPPFAITGISPHPIVARTFYEGPMYKTWKPLRVVFPGGYIVKGQEIWVAYGRQDHEAWVVKLNKKGLLDSLKPVQTAIPKIFQ